jgi:hypothetical protein
LEKQMIDVDKRVADRLMHGNATVNTRSAGGRTLYQDLTDLLRDYADLRRAVTHLSAVVNRSDAVES